MFSLIVPHNLIQVVALKKFDKILLDVDPKQSDLLHKELIGQFLAA